MIRHVVSVFVFKQKTAYDVRISDWSSDVCSSDLERLKPQKILINMELWVAETPGRPPRDYSEVVCYEQLVTSAKALLAEGHVDLVETLAEQLAVLCLADSRVDRCRVRVEKPEAIAEASGVGVEIERRRNQL